MEVSQNLFFFDSRGRQLSSLLVACLFCCCSRDHVCEDHYLSVVFILSAVDSVESVAKVSSVLKVTHSHQPESRTAEKTDRSTSRVFHHGRPNVLSRSLYFDQTGCYEIH